MSFIAELKRRNVIRLAGLYLVGAWLIVQVAETVLPAFDVSNWMLRAIIIVLALGFAPALVFGWVFELTPGGLKRDADVAAGQSIAPHTARRMDRLIIVVLILALGYFSVDKYVLGPGREASLLTPSGQAMKSPRAHETPHAITGKSIAVLPFVNMSADVEQQYFSDGLSEDLITALSQFEGLKVISRNSSFHFRDSKDDSRTIGAKLGVAHLLAGSVRRAGDMVRVSADLVHAADGRTLWSQRYDRPYTELFKLQDEITAAVTGTLRAKLLTDTGTVPQSDRPPGGNLDAYNAYLKGKFYAARGARAEDLKAIDAFEEAIRLEPRYAHANASLANVLTRSAGLYLGGAQALQAYDNARKAIKTALDLDPELAYAHVVRGNLLVNADLDWANAEAAFRRAFQLAPDDPVAMSALASLLATMGQMDAAVDLGRRAVTKDPLSIFRRTRLAGHVAGLGRLEEAEEVARGAVELQAMDAALAELAAILVLRGKHAEAIDTAQQMEVGLWQDSAMAYARQGAGDRVAADAALKVLLDNHADLAAYQIAGVYAQRKEPDQVFAWLDRAWASRDPGISSLPYDPFLRPYHTDPRFAAFSRKVGLPVPARVP